MIELKNFTDLTSDEKAMVLKWRNDPRIRSHMYTDALISETDHENFIHSLKTRSDKLYFVVSKNQAPIGVIDLVDITETSATLGLYANPFSDRLGIGKIMLRSLIRYAFETLRLTLLRLECFEDNEKAQALYKKFDFSETERKIKNTKTIICMELHRENRQP